MEFKVGDRIKGIIEGYWIYNKENKIIAIKEKGINCYQHPKYQNIYQVNSTHFCEKDLELVKEGTMDKYTELKQRIENITAWDKEADDILNEICNQKDYWICIGTEHKQATDYVQIVDAIDNKFKLIVEFAYHSQCQKLSSFRLALLWLLDHSDIKKPEVVEAGDYVVAIGEEYFSTKQTYTKLRIGDVFIAGRKTNNEYVFLNNNDTSNCFQRDVRKATQQEIEDYKKKTLVGTEQKIEIEGKIYKARILNEEN